MATVYVLRCTGPFGVRLYVGSTFRPLEERIAEHKSGQGGVYTARFKEVEAVVALYVPKENARSVEAHLKKNRYLVRDVVEFRNGGTRKKSIDNLEKWLKDHKIDFNWVKP